MQNDKIKKAYKHLKSLNPSELVEVRNKLIPLFLDLEREDPYKDKKVIKLLKKRYQLAREEFKQRKTINAEKYLRKSIG